MPSSHLQQPMKLAPVLAERPWGGRRLGTVLGRELPTAARYGESWEVADHPDGRSLVADAPFAGERFGDVLRRHPGELCGLDAAPSRYPIMVKYLDVVDHLSLQVHPPDSHAPEGDRGKAECWYVMQCEAGSELILGLHEHVTRESLFEVLRLSDPSARLDEVVRRVPIRAGSFLHVPAGTVHAILGGCMICEVQQASNVTYRLWDWNRKPARPLHHDKGYEVVRIGMSHHATHTDTTHQPTDTLLVANEHFEVRLAVFANPAEAVLALENPHGVIVNVVAGSGSWRMHDGEPGGKFHLGDTWYLPPSVGRLRVTPGVRDLRLLVSRSLELG